MPSAAADFVGVAVGNPLDLGVGVAERGVAVAVPMAVAVALGVAAGVGLALVSTRIKAPFGSLPVLEKGTNGGLIACTYAGPGAAPAGTANRSSVSLTNVIAMAAAPLGVKPPRLAIAPFWVA